MLSKTERSEIFRRRLLERLSDSGKNRSELARLAGVDRSTIVQLLNADEPRLPNAHLAASIAQSLAVSVDWLLGVSDRRETAAELLMAGIGLEDAARTPSDEQIIGWHREAVGQKIRHVPATLPDILKTRDLLEWEYGAFRDKTPSQAHDAMEATVTWLESPGSDYEMCVPLHHVRALARGDGYWSGVPENVRREQVQWMAEACDQRYPSLRVYIYDSRELYSAPLTIFGSMLAALYVGKFYMVFRERNQVSALTRHFDHLIREARHEARSAGDVMRSFL
ncbi:MAG: helix-turn-helix domain-containing protein [Pseudomonadota bacterium]